MLFSHSRVRILSPPRAAFRPALRSGIICGCFAGLTQFFCFCQGLFTIYFGSNSSKQTKSTKRGCAKCAEGNRDVVEPVQITIDRT